MVRRRYSMRTVVIALLLALVVPTGSGCVWTPELARVKDDIERQLPDAHFEKEFSLSLGPIALGLARIVTRLVPDTGDARVYLKDVHRVQVAVYNTSTSTIGNVRMPQRLRRMAEDGWETAIRARQDDGVVWVMYRADEESVRELYVVVLDDEELVIVKASGRLERLLARALMESDDIPGVPHVDPDAM